MNSTVIMTIIICITVVLLYFITAWEKVQARKEVMKKVKKFTDAFGDIKPKPVNKKQDDDDDKPLKFGDE